MGHVEKREHNKMLKECGINIVYAKIVKLCENIEFELL